MTNDFLDTEELATIGFRSLGKDVCVSRRAAFFRPDCIDLGNYVRIDAFCILSSSSKGIRIGRNVHVSAYSAILGQEAVEVGDFATISLRCTILSSSDDYSGVNMGNATIPLRFRGAREAPVVIQAHAMIGAGAIVLPGVTVGESACVGAMSLVKNIVAPFEVVGGVPARAIGRRRSDHRALAEKLLCQEALLNSSEQTR